MGHEVFRFRDRIALEQKIRELGLDLPLVNDISILFSLLPIAGHVLPNRLVIHPMEGADAAADGSPSELTFRRYRCFARSGAAIIWFEATSVCPEGRSNPSQLLLSSKTVDGFKTLVEQTERAARQKFGSNHSPLFILQLTHSGRFSAPEGKPAPLIAQPNPILDAWMGLPDGYPLITDAQLDSIQDDFVSASSLASQAGFHGVDIKACHGYLVSELLASRMRLNSRYGGSFENRTRFLLETAAKIKQKGAGIFITSRLNVVDGLPWPYGFGSSSKKSETEDLSELKLLTRRLARFGPPLLSLSLGIPAYNPHYGRPSNVPLLGESLPDEHPLVGVARHLRLTAELQRSFPSIPILGAGYSWLRHFFPYAAAAVLQAKKASLIGLGRLSLAYPEWPDELAKTGCLDPGQVCLACSRCSQLLRGGGPVGCVVRGAKLYGENYSRIRKKLRRSPGGKK